MKQRFQIHNASKAAAIQTKKGTGRIAVSFESPGGIMGTKNKLLYPRFDRNGVARVRAFNGIWTLSAYAFFAADGRTGKRMISGTTGKPYKAIIYFNGVHEKWLDEPKYKH